VQNMLAENNFWIDSAVKKELAEIETNWDG
jgi:hypothetical protein